MIGRTKPGGPQVPSDYANTHAYDEATGSPVIPASNWLAPVSPSEAVSAGLRPLPSDEPRHDHQPGDSVWTVADHSERRGWRIWAGYRKAHCSRCGRRVLRLRGWIPDNLHSWYVGEPTRFFRALRNTDTAQLICSLCWMNMSSLPPHILEQKRQLELAA